MINEIIQRKKEQLQRLKSELPLDRLKKMIKYTPKGRLFKDALTKTDDVALIAELKKASPSKGILRSDFDPLEIAKIYEKEGVDAVSVLTEKDFFEGDLNYMPLLKKNINLPLLQKDFFIDEYQIYHSAYLGSDAILLIASILRKEKISNFISTARRFNIDSLVEVHNEADLKKAMSVKADIIGINNRNLETFKVDIQNTAKLIALIPKLEKITVVSESGINSYKDILFLGNLGVDAVLIGESFMKSEDISKKIRRLRGLK